MTSSDIGGPPSLETAVGAAGPDEESRAATVVIGLGVMMLGILLLLGRLDLIDFRLSGRLMWPFIVLGLGLAKLVAPGSRGGRPRSRRSGAWLVWIGLWGLVTEFHVFGFDYDTSWPLLVVGVGLSIIWRAFEDARTCPAAGRS